MQDFDVVIVGGGFVGMTIALGLAQKTPWRVALLEQATAPMRAGSDFDARAIALVPSSIELFQELNIWPILKNHTQSIENIHVSEKGRFGQVQLKSSEMGFSYFGKVIEAQFLGEQLLSLVKANSNISLISGAKLTDFSVSDQGVSVTWEHPEGAQTSFAKCLIAADGAQSFIRTQLKIECETQTFDQSALVANILPDRPHQQSAYERFTPSGPLALLPISENRMTLIWCDALKATEARAKLSDEELIREFQTAFGFRAGRFLKIGKRHTFPLNQFMAKEQFRDRIVLLGNTAHTLHPAAAQGLNLSLRDIAALLKQFEKSEDPGARSVLQAYAEKRLGDQKMIHDFTHSLVFGFGVNNFVAGKCRSVGMTVFNCLPGAKKLFARKLMGGIRFLS